MATILFGVMIGFFIFYVIDNPGVLDKIFDRGQEIEETGNTEVSETVTTESIDTSSTQESSLWQKITDFFKEKFNPPQETESYPSRLTINAYFVVTGEGEMLAAEERSIIAGNPGNALKAAMEELLMGPVQSYHYPVIPAGTRLLDSRVADSVAEVDLSSEFLENALDTRILDEYIIYSIVNTVTEIPDISGVIFFIEGKRIKAFGDIDLSIPLIRNNDLIPQEE